MTWLTSPAWIAVMRLALAAYVLLILALSLLPQPLPEGVEINDKIGHLLAFFGLGLLADMAFPKQRPDGMKLLNLLLIGILIEAMQHHTQYRTASLADLAADGFGLLAYALSRKWFSRKYLLKEHSSCNSF